MCHAVVVCPHFGLVIWDHVFIVHYHIMSFEFKSDTTSNKNVICNTQTVRNIQ